MMEQEEGEIIGEEEHRNIKYLRQRAEERKNMTMRKRREKRKMKTTRERKHKNGEED